MKQTWMNRNNRCWQRWSLALAMLCLTLPLQAAQPSSVCTEAGLTGQALGICQSYCGTLDCTAPENNGSTQCQLPCEASTCDFLDPVVLFERITYISNPDYVCYADQGTPYEYVEYIIESGGVPQIGFGLEDQFDGTWYGYYFEYQEGSPGALPEFYRYDLTLEQVDQCRQAFEPPWDCSSP